jgi:hypothetical protein
MMTMKTRIRAIAVGAGLIATTLAIDLSLQQGLVIGEAHARLGRPATPASVAGVARRTTRRTIRRTSVYAATLPRGCSTVVIEGTTLHHCGSTYYQPHGGQYVVVHVD